MRPSVSVSVYITALCLHARCIAYVRIHHSHASIPLTAVTAHASSSAAIVKTELHGNETHDEKPEHVNIYDFVMECMHRMTSTTPALCHVPHCPPSLSSSSSSTQFSSSLLHTLETRAPSLLLSFLSFTRARAREVHARMICMSVLHSCESVSPPHTRTVHDI